MKKVYDPVCGMEVSPDKAAGSSQYEGQTYYFCSPSCKKQFDADPQQFVKPPQGSHGHHGHH
jgi:Cu+-exporting ATPase